MPAAAFWLKLLKGFSHSSAAASANGEFTHHNRKPKHHKKHKIHQNECRTAVHSANIGKFPNIPDSYRTACGNQNESKA